MPRIPAICYYRSRNAYYTKMKGRQHLLAAGPKDGPDGPTFQAAKNAYHDLLDVERNSYEDGEVLSVIIVRYFNFLEKEGRLKSLKVARTLLRPAMRCMGRIKVKDLKPFAVHDWLDTMTSWNSTTKHTAVGALITLMRWAVTQGRISANPLVGLKRPEKLVRGKEVLIPEELQDLLISVATPTLGDVLKMLRGTGARIGEIIHAKCEHYDREHGALIFPWNPPPGEWRWKNAKKTKRDRVIYLGESLQKLVEDNIRQRGEKGGLIFLSPRGKPWKDEHIRTHLYLLMKKEPVKEWCKGNNFNGKNVLFYSFRHGYITKMLTNGCPIKLLADLCGTSVAMIEKTYSHAADDKQAMRRLFLMFHQDANGEPSPSPGDSRK